MNTVKEVPHRANAAGADMGQSGNFAYAHTPTQAHTLILPLNPFIRAVWSCPNPTLYLAARAHNYTHTHTHTRTHTHHGTLQVIFTAMRVVGTTAGGQAHGQLRYPPWR